MSDILTNKNVKARRTHRCSLCGEAISPGESYRLCVGRDGAQFFRCRIHHECDKVPLIDGWDDIEWTHSGDEVEFRKRRDELRASGMLT